MILLIIATTSNGYFPMDVSAESITKSVSSIMALVTSVASAREGGFQRETGILEKDWFELSSRRS